MNFGDKDSYEDGNGVWILLECGYGQRLRMKVNLGVLQRFSCERLEGEGEVFKHGDGDEDDACETPNYKSPSFSERVCSLDSI